MGFWRGVPKLSSTNYLLTNTKTNITINIWTNIKTNITIKVILKTKTNIQQLMD